MVRPSAPPPPNKQQTHILFYVAKKGTQAPALDQQREATARGLRDSRPLLVVVLELPRLARDLHHDPRLPD